MLLLKLREKQKVLN